MPDVTGTPSNSATVPSDGQSVGRLKNLDLIRGVAILGILPVNMTLFSGPGLDSGPSAETWHGRLVNILVMLLFEGKMVTLLSLLFGAGLALQAGHVQTAGKPFVPYYARRMLVLFLIGLTHALLISHLDILTSYAAAGLMALMFVRRTDRSLLRWAGGFLTWCYGSLLLATVLVMLVSAIEFENGDSQRTETEVAEQADEQMSAAEEEDGAFSALENLFSTENEIQIFRHGSFGEVVFHRIVYLSLSAAFFLVETGWYVLACMLIGVWLIRRGVFHRTTSLWGEFRKRIGLALGWGVLCHAAAAVAYLRNPDGILYFCFLGFGILPLAFVYLSMLILWGDGDRLPWLQTRLQEVGRLALSNYLLQSILCGFIFFGFGLGLYGKLPPAATLAVVLVVWIVQIVVSRWWLTRFRLGPAEWLWRSVAEGRR